MPLEANDDALIGTVLEGRFQIESVLGEGGMGRVYLAEELRLRRRCAVKVLLPDLAQDAECVERFMREAQAIAQIHHENVVDIYHLGDASSGFVFFAMELLSGEDLETRLFDRERRPVSWQQVVLWMAQVAGAVEAVHAAGMIHRDLKPSNIFLARRRDGRDQIKLLDFGIAKVASSAALTNTGAAIGTPFYMSPEQILAEALDHRTDIYSFGVLFFEALTGRRPFVGEPIQVAMQHCNIPAPRMADVNPAAEIPEELEDLIGRMLAKAREARPQTMEEIESYLHELIPTNTPTTNSGLIARPLTGPIGGARATPSSLPLRSTADARTRLESSRQPAATVEITVDPIAAVAPKPEARSKLLPALLGLAALVLAVAGAYALGRDDGAPPAPPSPVVVTPPPEEPKPQPPEPPQQPQPQPTTTAAVEPVPTDIPPEPPPTKTDEPKVRKPDKTGDKPGDPMRQIAKAAAACRKKYDAARGPKITIDYAIRSDGVVNRAVPSTPGDLGQCLAEAVKKAKFAPELKLGLKIDL